MVKIGIVVIGRNEGRRLQRSLQSILRQTNIIVYVDSDSADGSISYAKRNSIPVVKLDISAPLSAARARNVGFSYLVRQHPDVQYIQFVDGDCELCEGWLETACIYLDQHERCCIVAGRTVEKFPEKSIYNLLCDLEWRTAAGSVASCGGIFMIRKELFAQLGGFNQSIIAGEEPELCHRLRRQGWEVHRLGKPMVLHDADMRSFSQWWRRSVRSGFAYAQALSLHGCGRGALGFKDSLRIWLWGAGVPFCIVLLTILFGPQSLLLCIAYPVQMVRVASSSNRRFGKWQHSIVYSFFIMLAKWPQLYGQVKFWIRKYFGTHPGLIEYK